MVRTSVIIPTYERPLKLKRALISVINQTVKDIEILVINDGHPGNEESILEIIDDLNDNRIKYFPNQRKKGGNGARNTGILNAKGQYIAFLDDDDEFLPEKTELSIGFLERTNYAGAIGRFYFEFNQRWYKSKSINQDINLRNFILSKISLGSSSNLFAKKNIFSDIGLWNEDLEHFQDLELVARILDKYKLFFINRVLIKVYGHNDPDAERFKKIKLYYLKTISPYIEKLSIGDKKQFYSFQFRELALAFGLQGNITKMLMYLKISLKYKFLIPSRYARFFLILIERLIPFDFQKIWLRIKYSIEFISK